MELIFFRSIECVDLYHVYEYNIYNFEINTQMTHHKKGVISVCLNLSSILSLLFI